MQPEELAKTKTGGGGGSRPGEREALNLQSAAAPHSCLRAVREGEAAAAVATSAAAAVA